MKVCSSCATAKPLAAFSVHSAGRLRPNCKACRARDASARRSADPERARRLDRERHQRDRDKRLAALKADYAKNRETRRAAANAKYRDDASHREKTIAAAARWYAENKQRAREAVKRWAAENKDYMRAFSVARAVKYRAVKLRAVPPWADLEAIGAVYARAADLRRQGFDVHVDHIVPLQGKAVCGLHVHWNLQLLYGPDNCAKGNRMPAEHEALAYA